MDAHPSHEIAFTATLTARQRRLAGRLEGFGDIVFGFAVAQCALQLPTDHGHVDLERPLALIFYFLTFALVATLWLIFHRMMSGTYVPSGVDLFLAFAYLALVSLIPYGMYALDHGVPTVARARSAVGAYTAIYATMALLAAILSMRNLRRGYRYLGDDDRDHAWATFLRQAILFVLMAGAFGIDRIVGPAWAGLELLCIFPAIRIARRLYPHPPSAEALRVAPLTAAPAASQRAS
jgi:uncharacterized membrane protein